MRSLLSLTLASLLGLNACSAAPTTQRSIPGTDSSDSIADNDQQAVTADGRYSGLSASFDCRFTPEREWDGQDSVTLAIRLFLYRKGEDQPFQTLIQKTDNWLASTDYQRPYLRSESTGKTYNEPEEGEIGHTGDVVIADLNFDGREDIALISDHGYADFYTFYLQDASGRFEPNGSLTDNVRLFPHIDQAHRTLHTFNLEGSEHTMERVFEPVGATASYFSERAHFRVPASDTASYAVTKATAVRLTEKAAGGKLGKAVKLRTDGVNRCDDWMMVRGNVWNGTEKDGTNGERINALLFLSGGHWQVKYVSVTGGICPLCQPVKTWNLDGECLL